MVFDNRYGSGSIGFNLSDPYNIYLKGYSDGYGGISGIDFPFKPTPYYSNGFFSGRMDSPFKSNKDLGDLFLKKLF